MLALAHWLKYALQNMHITLHDYTHTQLLALHQLVYKNLDNSTIMDM